MTPYKGKQITISSLTIWAYKNSKINLEFDSTQAMNLVKPRKTHYINSWHNLSFLEELVNTQNIC